MMIDLQIFHVLLSAVLLTITPNKDPRHNSRIIHINIVKLDIILYNTVNYIKEVMIMMSIIIYPCHQIDSICLIVICIIISMDLIKIFMEQLS